MLEVFGREGFQTNKWMYSQFFHYALSYKMVVQGKEAMMIMARVTVGATTENLFLRLEFHTCYNSQILPVGIHHPSSQENGKRWYGLGVELGNGSVPSFLWFREYSNRTSLTSVASGISSVGPGPVLVGSLAQSTIHLSLKASRNYESEVLQSVVGGEL